MATRIKEGMIPYKGGIGIEITNNHIINILLREANNLIHVNENNELYVDLQLPEGIAPDDDFPVWVTTGRIIQADWWQQSGLILNWKTTSGDYARLIYANDWNVYIDIWDWIWRLLGWEWTRCNTRTFWIDTNQDLDVAQQVYDWMKAGNNALIIHEESRILQCYSLSAETIIDSTKAIDFASHYMSYVDRQRWYTKMRIPLVQIWVDMNTDEVQYISFQKMRENSFIEASTPSGYYINAFIPTDDTDPTSKKYVDDELLKKQDLLTAWTRITIQTDPNTGDLVISADVSGVMVYKGNVTDPSQLPVSWQQQWDCWYSESDWHLYAWDGTQWKDIWWITPNLTNYFNKTVDDSDDITQWSTNLFVTQTEKNRWNNKQDQLTAGTNITIDQNNVISAVDTTYTGWSNISINGNNAINNDAPFDPDNAGAMGQVLTKTSNWYEWKNPATSPSSSYTAWTGINIDQNDVISNTWVLDVNGNTGSVNVEEFLPDNQWNVGQVLKRTQNGYEWQNESWWWGGWQIYYGWIGITIDGNYIDNDWVLTINGYGPDWIGNIDVNEFNPYWTEVSWYVLKSDGNGWYYWAQESWGGGWWGTTYTAWDWINIDANNVISNTNRFIPSNQWATGQVLKKTANGYEWSTNLNNVELFTINTQSYPWYFDLSIAQSALDWYLDWNLPIIRAYGTHSYYDTQWTIHNITWRWDYYPEPSDAGISNELVFVSMHNSFDGYANISANGYTEQHDYIIRFTILNNVVSSVADATQTAAWTQFLSTSIDYSTPYTPLYDWSPATKKYVDDKTFVTVSSTAPANPKIWDMYLDPTYGDLYVRKSNSAWEQIWNIHRDDYVPVTTHWQQVQIQRNRYYYYNDSASIFSIYPSSLYPWMIYTIVLNPWQDVSWIRLFKDTSSNDYYTLSVLAGSCRTIQLVAKNSTEIERINKYDVVSVLPSNPDPNMIYYVK